MLFKSLEILTKPVEYIRYQRAGYKLIQSGKPRRMMNHMLCVIEFFECYTNHAETQAAAVK